MKCKLGLIALGASSILGGCKPQSTGAETLSQGTNNPLNCGFEQLNGVKHMVAHVQAYGGDQEINLRNGPSVSSASFGIVPSGTKVLVYSGNSREWVFVGVQTVNGWQPGFVSTTLLVCGDGNGFGPVALSGGTLPYTAALAGVTGPVASAAFRLDKPLTCVGSVDSKYSPYNYTYSVYIPWNKTVAASKASVSVMKSGRVLATVPLMKNVTSDNAQSGGSSAFADFGINNGKIVLNIDGSKTPARVILHHTPKIAGAGTTREIITELSCHN